MKRLKVGHKVFPSYVHVVGVKAKAF